ncbi:hypothetical protein C7379_1102 [Hallella colorans]|uniref:Uncharacterized protein n=1 Tax=Hallella colorans TaxID=1703337 RepID=A0A2U0U7H8_9BACT|nr:hypothetical protein C7379_1102 [Hallella colorans]
MRNRISTLSFVLLLWLSAFGVPVSKQKAQKLVENYNQMAKLLHLTTDKNVQNLFRELIRFTEKFKLLQ